jgi:hypothetical protein
LGKKYYREKDVIECGRRTEERERKRRKWAKTGDKNGRQK